VAVLIGAFETLALRSPRSKALVKAFKVHPAYDFDHVMEVSAKDEMDAAAQYLIKRPVRRDMFVGSGLMNEKVIKIDEILAAYPDLKQLLSEASETVQPQDDWTVVDDAKYSKIGGWLNAVAVGLVLSFGYSIYNVNTVWTQMQELDVARIEQAYPGFTGLIYFELCNPIFLMVLILVGGYCFIRKRRSTRVWMIALYSSAIGITVIDHFWVGSVMGDLYKLEPEEVTKMIRNGLFQAGFIIYFLVSERVKKTFAN